MEIDLKEIFFLLLSKAGSIILVGLICALLAIIGTKTLIKPIYQSVTKMYVLSKQNVDSLTTSDLQMSSYLTKDYVELIKSRTVTETVIANLDLNLTHEKLLGKMSVSSQSDTRIVSIAVKDADPYVAREIANEIRDTAAEHIKDVMDIEAVNVVDYANVPDHKAGPSAFKNGFLAGVLGVVAMCGIIIVNYMMNDTIKTSEDVERYLGLSTLGVIPMTKEEASKNKHKVKHRKDGSKWQK